MNMETLTHLNALISVKRFAHRACIGCAEMGITNRISMLQKNYTRYAHIHQDGYPAQNGFSTCGDKNSYARNSVY